MDGRYVAHEVNKQHHETAMGENIRKRVYNLMTEQEVTTHIICTCKPRWQVLQLILVVIGDVFADRFDFTSCRRVRK